MKAALACISLCLELTRYRIALFASFCAVAGFFLSGGRLVSSALGLGFSMFLLGGGSLLLNQYQERDTDSLMERTRNRPLPAGRCQPLTALMTALFLVTSGLMLTITFYGTGAFITALSAVILYNGVYTPLKRTTVFAFLPGLLCGALPPLVGTMAAGAAPGGEIIVLMEFLFLWQLPHFWLYGFCHRDDYELTPLKGVRELLGLSFCRRMAFLWILAAGVSALIFPLLGKTMMAVKVLLLLSTAALVLLSAPLLTGRERTGHMKRILLALTMYALFTVTLLTLNSLALPGA
jgi:heme o synthase